MNTDIVEIAKVVQDAMREYVLEHPEGSQENAEMAGVGAACRFTKGCGNPRFFKQLAEMEESVY